MEARICWFSSERPDLGEYQPQYTYYFNRVPGRAYGYTKTWWYCSSDIAVIPLE